MRSLRSIGFTLLLLPLLASCDRGIGRDNLAAAGDLRLSVEEAAQMVAGVPQLPDDPSVVRAVAEFWRDYALLALVVNDPELLGRMDVSYLVEQDVADMLLGRLRESVIQMDPDISDEELRAAWEEQRYGEEIRARHILLLFPPNATQAQSDSVRSLAGDLRDRARAGASFGELAQQYSADPGSAPQGGDLQYFRRGIMVPAFEEAAFALGVGQVSEVVETDFGLHIIRVEDRRRPTYEETFELFRLEWQGQLVMDAESLFVGQIEEAAAARLADGAMALLRQVTANPVAPLSEREGARALTEYTGGSYTAAEYRNFLLSQAADLHGQILAAADEQLEGFLLDLTREELLMAEAERRGLGITPQERADMTTAITTEYGSVADFMGLSAIQPESGERLRSAIDREVKELMTRIVIGEQELIPLGPLAFPLRTLLENEVSEEAITRTLDRVRELRAANPGG